LACDLAAPLSREYFGPALPSDLSRLARNRLFLLCGEDRSHSFSPKPSQSHGMKRSVLIRKQWAPLEFTSADNPF